MVNVSRLILRVALCSLGLLLIASCGRGNADPDQGLIPTNTGRSMRMDMGTALSESSCVTGRDSDGDGKFGCQDEDCALEPCSAQVRDAMCMDGQCVGGEVGALCVDGLDNDRDGLADAQDPDCSGSCVVSGCNEECNGVDDDEDTFVDEGCACPFRGFTTGVCVFGVLTVAQDLRCSTPPGYQSDERSCDGVDNDCDGAVDEGCACRFQDSNAGVCLRATRLPNGVCATPSAFEPNETLFDGLDNDCDGSVDEGSMRCDFMGSREGVCLYGRPGENATECNAPDGYISDEEGDEWCDGADNDCDGEVDEGCSCFFGERTRGVCLYGELDGSGSCGAPGVYEETESRCDGVDNDCDGEVDEGCQRCVIGTELQVANRNLGVCGASSLDASGACALPDTFEATETLCDGRDNDCDGATDEGCVCDFFGRPFALCAGAGVRDEQGICRVNVPPPVSSFELSCNDGQDNDCDNLTDCDDGDCAGVDGCPLGRPRETSCLPEDDENNNGLVGCEDPDCFFSPRCRFGEICGNGVDDDQDGLIDCADSGECGAELCAGEAGFSSGQGCLFRGDEDGDGLFGCDDPDCFGVRGCVDTACSNTEVCQGPRAPEDCSNGLDDDEDGRVDCSDRSCEFSPHCVVGERFCADGINDDGDESNGMELIDCDDPDCDGSPVCRR